MTDNIIDKNGVLVQGHIKIFDPKTDEIFIDKRNAIHYENMSIALAESLANAGQGFVYEMAFGNGGTSVDPRHYYILNSTLVLMQVYTTKHIRRLLMMSPNNVDQTETKLKQDT